MYVCMYELILRVVNLIACGKWCILLDQL